MPFSFTIDMPGGQAPYRITNLLGKAQSNAKLSKSENAGMPILSYGLSLAPSKASGFQLCPHASAGCIKGCLYKSGQANIFPRTILPPRIAKSRLLRKHPDVFKDRLFTELTAAIRRANKIGATLYVRLNVFSDVAWETEFPDIFTKFNGVRFYDYTKSFDRMTDFIRGNFPKNYHLTFSRSENNWSDCLKVLRAGYNVAVPFHVKYNWRVKQPLPAKFNRFRVIDGDISDVRPLDESPRIVGLRVKGPAAKADFTTGFVQPGGKG